MQKIPVECPFCHSVGSLKKSFCTQCGIYLSVEGRMVYKTTYVSDPDPMQHHEESEEVQEVSF